ncbi:N-acetylmuramoyl-L-alanine amidase [Novosphingobium sp. KCTC 2891]|uniref:N-acetylmuramoyl-L-alanine amidase family protein n=1 Tax=Novosphingobium sp. KCTC 2891 TaxID=2989730 RepID=UPI0022222327|nr:N-acetylmuramoyl-L-alanine amidase [Novosphingobium sp. KCTC 2891]MCW1381716.1 N-acetylmuramoyl-L-alanine amidase [Novosphingobium sp. KCTC 2891]
MNGRETIGRAILAAGFAVPLAVLAGWGWWTLHRAADNPAYVRRVALPSAEARIDLPRIEGPADASRPLVVIDAGHGGHDPGASGAGGQREKDVTLALARAVRDALLRQGRVRVAMTRDADRFLVLEERADVARRLGADLFVSIHADAADNPDASGATVYTLSERGSDAVADAVAQRENRADMAGGVQLGGASNTVSSILVDLSQREMRARSVAFGGLVRREGEGRLTFHANPQREAAFVVLKSLDLPSALVEAGYISNAGDAAAMADPAWRGRFAGVLASAIGITLARQEAGAAPTAAARDAAEVAAALVP